MPNSARDRHYSDWFKFRHQQPPPFSCRSARGGCAALQRDQADDDGQHPRLVQAPRDATGCAERPDTRRSPSTERHATGGAAPSALCGGWHFGLLPRRLPGFRARPRAASSSSAGPASNRAWWGQHTLLQRAAACERPRKKGWERSAGGAWCLPVCTPTGDAPRSPLPAAGACSDAAVMETVAAKVCRRGAGSGMCASHHWSSRAGNSCLRW